MKTKRLRDALDEMARRPGCMACVLVDTDAGMTWHSAGQLENIDSIGSSCSDYWRLNRRLQGNFTSMGGLRLVLLVHEKGHLILSECGKQMLLVAAIDNLRSVDWGIWRQQHAHIAMLVDDL